MQAQLPKASSCHSLAVKRHVPFTSVHHTHKLALAQHRKVVCNQASGSVFGFGNLLKLLQSPFVPQKPQEAEDPTRVFSKELLSQLLSPSPDQQRVEELVDELASSNLPFKEDVLGGGPWVVRFNKGKPLLWSITLNSSKVVNSKNRASQEFDPRGRTAVNKVELNGPETYVTASGVYEPVDDAAAMPKTIRARISSGSLRAFGRDWPLPISGTGLFEVMYADDTLRIFRSNGGTIAVQVRSTVLDETDE